MPADRNEILRRVRAAGGPSRELLERCAALVEKASVADRGLDTILADALGLVPDGYWRSPDLGVRYEADWRAGVRGPDWSPPPLTESVDAALALAERVLPGWRWVAHSPRSGLAYGASLSDPARGGRIVPAEHPVSTPLAILAAVLKAKIALTPSSAAVATGKAA